MVGEFLFKQQLQYLFSICTISSIYNICKCPTNQKNHVNLAMCVQLSRIHTHKNIIIISMQIATVTLYRLKCPYLWSHSRSVLN